MKDFYIINPSDESKFGNNDNTYMDIVYDESGILKTITGQQRLAQSLQKMLITNITSDINKIAPYGSYLPFMIGEKANPFFMKSFIVTTIYDSMANYKDMQQQLSNDLDIPDDELLRGVTNVQVIDIADNPGQYMVIVAIQNESENEFNVVLSLSKGQ